MLSHHHNQPDKSESTSDTKVNIGNASNPAALDKPPYENRVLGKDAEKYLREAGNIEDLPDEPDQEDMDETIEKDKKF